MKDIKNRKLLDSKYLTDTDIDVNDVMTISQWGGGNSRIQRQNNLK